MNMVSNVDLSLRQKPAAFQKKKTPPLSQVMIIFRVAGHDLYVHDHVTYYITQLLHRVFVSRQGMTFSVVEKVCVIEITDIV